MLLFQKFNYNSKNMYKIVIIFVTHILTIKNYQFSISPRESNLNILNQNSMPLEAIICLNKDCALRIIM